jgi:hypothetical protein
MTKIALHIPKPENTRLSFCKVGEKSLADWIGNLPLTNVGEASRELYRGISELNKLDVDAPRRLAMMEHIRQPIHFICTSLAKNYLNQSVQLDERQQKIARLTQALQNALAMGYKLVVAGAEAPAAGDDNSDKVTIAVGIHRAITDLSHTLLRACQLYTDPPKRLWADLHQLYMLAERLNLLDFVIDDQENQLEKKLRIADVYKRALLLGSSKPNNLRQKDLTAIFRALEVWSQAAELTQASLEALFVVDLGKDFPPVYRALKEGDSAESTRSFDTTRLVESLNRFLETGGKESPLQIPKNCSAPLLRHTAQAWGILTQRAFSRSSTEGTLQVVVGLSAAHYYCGKMIEFESQLAGGKTALRLERRNIFIDGHDERKPKNDVWAHAFDAGGNRIPVNRGINADELLKKRDNKVDEDALYECHSVAVADTSPSGYGIRWSGKAPANLQTGEIVAVRESDKEPWSIAAIRWIRKGSESTAIGMQLISPRAEAIGVRAVSAHGDVGDWTRALKLPELKAIKQPARMLVPRLNFRAKGKVEFNEMGAESRAQLTRVVAITENYTQYEYHEIDTEAAKKVDDLLSDKDFDSLWE